MRSHILAGAVALGFCLTLQGSLLPVLKLDKSTTKAFEDYTTQFEKQALGRFVASGALWIDDDPKKHAFESGKPVVQPRQNEDVANGSIHHFSGALHVNGGTIAQIRKVMEDYPNYPKYFKPDVGAASAEKMPDSTPEDEHFHGRLFLTQSTLWFNVNYDTLYDTHYRRIDANRWISKSTSLEIKEMMDAKNPSAGFYPQGDDHGFLWKTNTYWFARQHDSGIDLEADSISLSRPNVSGFAWWGTKRSHDAVEKMLKDIQQAMETVK